MSKFLKGYLMLKILNNDKFTTAQNRHFLVSLKIPILNTLPVRAKVWANGWLLLLPFQSVGTGYTAPRALPWAMNWLGFQPAQSRSANIQRRSEAQHLLSIIINWIDTKADVRY